MPKILSLKDLEEQLQQLEAQHLQLLGAIQLNKQMIASLKAPDKPPKPKPTD